MGVQVMAVAAMERVQTLAAAIFATLTLVCEKLGCMSFREAEDKA
jgi:hypothetical protein